MSYCRCRRYYLPAEARRVSRAVEPKFDCALVAAPIAVIFVTIVALVYSPVEHPVATNLGASAKVVDIKPWESVTCIATAPDKCVSRNTVNALAAGWPFTVKATRVTPYKIIEAQRS